MGQKELLSWRAAVSEDSSEDPGSILSPGRSLAAAAMKEEKGEFEEAEKTAG